MPPRHVALIRGINVGTAKRVAMADLRSRLEEAGFRDVRTLLNSGNVVFTPPAGARGSLAGRVESVLAGPIGVPARVTVLTAAEFSAVVRDCPLDSAGRDPSRLLAAFLRDPADRALLKPLEKRDWSPGQLAVGTHAAWLWCPDGLLASPLAEAVQKALGDRVTMRNRTTALKLETLARA